LILFCEENKLSKSKITRSPGKEKNILIRMSKLDEQEAIIKSLSEERNNYYSKLVDIEDEIRTLNLANITTKLFGISTSELCQRLTQIINA
jgi:hypothetical protein